MWLSFASLGLTLWRWAAGRLCLRELARRRADPLPQPPPGITILKPLHGLEPSSRECLESWLDQSYPGPVQFLFGVASADDPVCGLVRELFAARPGIDAQWVVCPQSLAPNVKVSTLMQLEGLIRHGTALVCDADTRVGPGFLAAAATALARPDAGMVHSLYRLSTGGTFGARWEAFSVNADFWCETQMAASLGKRDFALGAAMLLPRELLREMGGFAVLGPFLADDYQLGRAVAARGRRIEWCPEIVECREAPRTFAQAWAHQLRWARTLRACQPVPFFFSILNNGTLWPLALLAARPSTGMALAAWLCVAARIVCAGDLRRRFAGSGSGWMAPVKDLLGAAVWTAAHLGNEIEWREARLRVRRGGRLERPGAPG